MYDIDVISSVIGAKVSEIVLQNRIIAFEREVTSRRHAKRYGIIESRGSKIPSFMFAGGVEGVTIDNGRTPLHSVYCCTFTESRKSRQPVFELRIPPR